MKRTLMTMVAMVILFNAFTMKAEAGVRTNIQQRNFLKFYEEFKTELLEEFEDDEEAQELMKSVEPNYRDLGYGLYDIYFTVVMYDDNEIEIHFIYDIVDDNQYSGFIVVDGDRYESDYLEELYPEL